MVLKITQQTFDDAVKENIEDLGMGPEEALSEAVKQFESQGVDLSQVQKQLKSEQPKPDIVQDTVTKLKCLIEKNETKPEVYIELIKILKQECDKGIDYKIFAATAGAYSVLLDVTEKCKDNKDILKGCIRCLTSLMTKHPDILDDRGINVIQTHLEPNTDKDIVKLILKWTRECCIMHEMNRQHLFGSNIVSKLKVFLEKEDNVEMLRDIFAVFRALILDDDVRVEFGRAHEHAKNIAAVTLLPIISLIKTHKHDEALVCDLLLTLSSLLVRSEFCKQIEEENGLELIHDVMQKFIKSEKITRQCFKLLKALAGNDDCKAKIIQKGLAPVITNSLSFHKKSSQTASSGLLAVSALSLRSPDNSKAFFEASLPDAIVEIMKIHPDEKTLQKNGSWAIRNMVSRSRYQNSHFLELGVEEILQNDLRRFKEFAYDFKAALRDLECDVQLNEEWTGKGGLLTTDSVKIK